MVTETPTGEWFINVDLWITRRKRYHTVINPDGEVVHKSRLLARCVEYLALEGVKAYTLRMQPIESVEVVQIAAVTKGDLQWQK